MASFARNIRRKMYFEKWAARYEILFVTRPAVGILTGAYLLGFTG